jgi:hypothetical protein
MGRACGTIGEKRNVCKLVVGKPEEKRLLGRKRCSCWIVLRWILEGYDGVVYTGLI